MYYSALQEKIFFWGADSNPMRSIPANSGQAGLVFPLLSACRARSSRKLGVEARSITSRGGSKHSRLAQIARRRTRQPPLSLAHAHP